LWISILFLSLAGACAIFSNKTADCTVAFERCWARLCPHGGWCVADSCNEMKDQCLQADDAYAREMRLREERLHCPDCAGPESREGEGDR
jgi:hypothetical protein